MQRHNTRQWAQCSRFIAVLLAVQWFVTLGLIRNWTTPDALVRGSRCCSQPMRNNSMAEQQYISFEPDSFIQGGLINDMDVEISEIQWCGWDYDGKSNVSEDVLAVKASLTPLDENGKVDPQATPIEQYWSAGGNFSEVGGVTDDGYRLIPGENKANLTRGSNFNHLVVSISALGAPKGHFADGNLGKLKGLKIHVMRKKIERSGLDVSNRRGGDAGGTTLIATKILWAPWDKSGKAQTGTTRAAAASKTTNGAAAAQPTAATSAGAAPPAPAVTGDNEAAAIESVKSILGGADNGTMDLKALKVAVFRAHSKTPAATRNAIVALAENATWLEANGFGISDGSVILL